MNYDYISNTNRICVNDNVCIVRYKVKDELFYNLKGIIKMKIDNLYLVQLDNPILEKIIYIYVEEENIRSYFI